MSVPNKIVSNADLAVFCRVSWTLVQRHTCRYYTCFVRGCELLATIVHCCRQYSCRHRRSQIVPAVVELHKFE
jgi:hypothetical protein